MNGTADIKHAIYKKRDLVKKVWSHLLPWKQGDGLQDYVYLFGLRHSGTPDSVEFFIFDDEHDPAAAAGRVPEDKLSGKITVTVRVEEPQPQAAIRATSLAAADEVEAAAAVPAAAGTRCWQWKKSGSGTWICFPC